MKVTTAKITKVWEQNNITIDEGNNGEVAFHHIKSLLSIINEYLRYSVWIICLCLLVYAWILLIKADWDEGALKKANYIISYIVGWLVVVFFAGTIIKIITNLQF